MAKATLDERHRGFSTIREARNVVEKEGNLVLGEVVSTSFTNGPVEAMDLRPDPVSGVTHVTFDLREGSQHALNPLTDESLLGLTQEQVGSIMRSKALLMSDLSAKLGESQEKLPAEPLYELMPGLELKSLSETVRFLSDFQGALEALLDSADDQFGLNLPGIEPAT